MSTKTTFKRVALVAVAALGFGTLSVAPSTAADVPQEGPFRNASFVTSPATATVGVAVTAIVKVGSSCINDGLAINNNADNIQILASYTTQIDAAPTGTNLAGNSVDVVNSNGTATVPSGYTNTNSTTVRGASDAWNGYRNTIQASCTAATGPQTAHASITFMPDVAGSYTVVVAPLSATTGAITWTVVASAPTQKFATAFIGTSASPTADTTSLTYPATTNTTVDAYLTVRQYSSTDATTLATNAISKDVVVAISKGLVSKTNDYFAGAKSVTTAAATAATSDYFVFANGEVGSADLTVTVGGTLLSTKKIIFNGTAKTLSAAVASGQPTWIIPTGTSTLTVSAKDEAGNTATNNPVISVASATTSVATVTKNSDTSVTITGVAAGTSVITISDSATSSPATSTTYTVTVAPAQSATLPTLTFDKAEYAAGELMTITIAAAAADNATFAAFAAAPTTSVNVVTVKNPFLGNPVTGNVALVSGKATWTAYAPITAGPITVTATSASGVGAGSSATAATVTATATVLTDGVAQAAADAAAEAIDAANAATDAANAAAEAADAATAAAQDAADAVAALSVQVSEEIAVLKAQNDALRKQLISLTNLIIKIQKKVKA